MKNLPFMQDQKKNPGDPGFLGTSLIVPNVRLEANTAFEVDTPES